MGLRKFILNETRFEAILAYPEYIRKGEGFREGSGFAGFSGE